MLVRKYLLNLIATSYRRELCKESDVPSRENTFTGYLRQNVFNIIILSCFFSLFKSAAYREYPIKLMMSSSFDIFSYHNLHIIYQTLVFVLPKIPPKFINILYFFKNQTFHVLYIQLKIIIN